MRGSDLIQVLIGLYSTHSPKPWFAFVTRMRYAAVSNVRFVFVLFLLPFLCGVIVNKDALGIIVYT